MGELTIPVSYRLEENRIEPMSYFLYEVSLYKITENTANIIDSKYFKSNKFLEIKIECKKFKNFLLIRYVNLLGAPIEFIRENDIPIYELRNPSKNKKK